MFDEFDVVVTSYETAVSDSGLLAMVRWAAVALDEAQAIKNPDTRRRFALNRISGQSRIAMTGTPVENRALDLWSLADFVAPGHLGTRSQFEASLADDPEALHQSSRAILIRREVANVAGDLPNRVVSDVALDMFGSEAEAYDRLLRGLERDHSNVLAAFTRLRQFSAHPHSVGLLTHLPPTESSMKFAYLNEILEELREEGKKVTVFAAFQSVVDLILGQAQSRLSLAAWAIDGRTPLKRRQPIIDEFSACKGAGLLILNPQAAGVGVNIQAASHVIHYSLEWNPAREDQATARVWRRGQDKTVFVVRPFYPETIDAVILQKLNEKRLLASRVVRPRDTDSTEIGELLRAALQIHSRRI